MGTHTLRTLKFGALFVAAIGLGVARADDDNPIASAQPNLVKQASAPISSIMQVRLQDAYAPQFTGLQGQGNTFAIALTMPLPEHRLLPVPQLSLLTIPAAVTLPSGLTGFGDLKIVDIAMLHAENNVYWGVGPTFVFPTASNIATGQGKWQAGPAAAVAFSPKRWLFGVLAQNPISFAGDRDRADANAMILQPFVTYQLGSSWFIRSQPQMFFDWKTGKHIVPLDLGLGLVFKIGRQNLNCYVEPFWNTSYDGPTPKYGISFGISLLYPNFWKKD